MKFTIGALLSKADEQTYKASLNDISSLVVALLGHNIEAIIPLSS